MERTEPTFSPALPEAITEYVQPPRDEADECTCFDLGYCQRDHENE